MKQDQVMPCGTYRGKVFMRQLHLAGVPALRQLLNQLIDLARTMAGSESNS